MPATPVLSNRALLLAKPESTYNVDALPSPTADAFLVSATDVKINPNVLKRNFYKPSLSPLGIAIGRKLATVTFTHEVKGSGLAGTAPKLGTLMKGCGFGQTVISATAASEIQTPVPGAGNTGAAITWGKTAGATSGWGRYHLKVALGGVSATAEFIVFGNPPDVNDFTVLPADDFSATVMGPGATTTVVVDAVTNPLLPSYTIGTPQVGDVIVVSVGGVRTKYIVASNVAATEATALATAMADPHTRYTAAAATAVITATITGGVTGAITSATTVVALGASGATITPTWSGTLLLNDTFVVDVLQPGYHYTPVSTGFTSFTMYVYYDGTLHRLTGCIGTFTITAAAGNYATATFTFTGQYNNPDDEPLPTNSIFESTVPQQVELAELLIGNAKNICAQQFTLDMAVVVNPRECVSNSDGYNGVNYTSRDPKGTANPEMAYESEEPYWRNLAAAKFLEFHARVGTTPLNEVKCISHSVQLANIAYADRNNLRAEDLSFQFAAGSFAGDDEIRFAFV